MFGFLLACAIFAPSIIVGHKSKILEWAKIKLNVYKSKIRRMIVGPFDDNQVNRKTKKSISLFIQIPCHRSMCNTLTVTLTAGNNRPGKTVYFSKMTV